jgi:uncharacterized membrane protein
MRSIRDRIRHAVSFEIIGLLLITPLGAWAFDKPASDIGLVGLFSATIATGWNYLYNLGFDHALERMTGSTLKSTIARVAHAVLFELGLLIALMPLFVWSLGIDITEALAMELSFALFYVVYAFVFNWLYDRLFPLPEWREKTA